MKHSFLIRLLVLISVSSLAAFASSYTFTGPDYPSGPNGNDGPSNFIGTPCTVDQTLPGGGNCTPGGVEFDILSATLQSNTAGTWTLTVQTYAPNSYDGFGPNAFGDALIEYNGLYYGIALGTPTGSYADGATAHDGLTAGDLYQEDTDVRGNPNDTYTCPSLSSTDCMYFTAGEEIGAGRINEPVWINPNGVNTSTPYGTSSSFNVTENSCYASGVQVSNCADSTYGLYTITDTFSTSTSFLSSGVFSFEVASYVCANGLIIASTPEPRGMFLIIPVVLLLGWCFKRHAALGKVS